MPTQTLTYTRPRWKSLLISAAMFNAFALAATWTNASSLIDFETTPAGLTPVDDAPLSQFTPYTFPGLAISFGLDTNSDGIVDTDTVFEHAGLDPGEPPNAGFSGSAGTDTADPGFTAQLGNWFLRSPVGGSNFGKLVITYSSTSPVTAASGEIWDIDGTAQFPGGPGDTEEYTVRAYDSLNNLLATQISPLGTLTSAIAPLDGEPWVFSFSGLSAGIAQITVDFTGTKTAGIGLAFNNFDPTQAAVPEPATWMMLVAGAAALLVWNRQLATFRRARPRQFSHLLVLAAALIAIAASQRSARAVTLNNGDLVVLESFPSRVLKIDPTNGAQTLISSSITDQLTEKVEVAPWGMIYAITRFSNKLLEIDPATGGVSTISSGQYFVNPRGLDFTPAGDIIVVDTGGSYDGRVVSVNRFSGLQTQLFNYTTFGPYTYDGAVATNGDLYVLEQAGQLAKYTGIPNSVTPIPLSGASMADGLALEFEASGDLVAVANGGVQRIALPSGNVTNVTSAGYMTNSLDLAVNRTTGDIYVADYNNPYIVHVDPITGLQSLVSSGGLLTRPTGITVVEASVPEPITLASVALGMSNLIGLGWRSRKN